MIADFRYQTVPGRDQVVIKLFWENNEPMGRVIVPSAIEQEMDEADMPKAETFPVFTAIGYGVLLAGKSQRPLCLTGDRSVWDTNWGRLKEAH
ncbi:hypothetical protein JP75_20805 [Devosia riboflavina]|uniref:Uncharacterized protein n=1 Tax=Devosia riboflavina TaxID=46914 RepID=A0A087LY08_9HYPH|nr:hypothetical protein [Devosia riboflavina]KFL29511.1 hypothetical protein JP75_20805 [Devosia riboflavina]